MTELKQLLDDISTIDSDSDGGVIRIYSYIDEIRASLLTSTGERDFYLGNDYEGAVDEINAKLTVAIGDKPLEIVMPAEDEPIADNPEVADLLAGFAFPATKGMPSVYIGKRNRLYLKGAFKATFNVQPQSRVIIGYNPAEDAFAVVQPSALAGNREAQAAGYFVSKRYDVTAAKLFRQYNIDKHEGKTYHFDRASSDASVAIFRRY